jgi:hypothetical protein
MVVLGATGCDVGSGTIIGNATISPDQFTVNLDSAMSVNSTMEYTFYAGQCPGSDGGQVLDLSICLADTIATDANNPDSYPLTSGTVSSPSFVFDGSLSPRNAWATHSYSVFPLGSSTRQYLTGHIEICQA